MPHVWRTLLLGFVGVVACPAQLIPWSEPPSVVAAEPAASAPIAALPRALPAKKQVAAPAEIPVSLPASQSDGAMSGFLSSPAALVLTSFASTDPGSARAGSSWLGQVTQNASSLTVGGTAADDNGWGATGLSFNATGFTSLAITAQRDAGNIAPSLFIQFEDRTLRTFVFAVNTSQFAVGTPTTVQIPLGSWTVDFGAHDISGWSIGGGSVGTLPFRMTFDEVSFGTSAIPEPSTYAALLGALGLAIAWRRRLRYNCRPSAARRVRKSSR